MAREFRGQILGCPDVNLHLNVSTHPAYSDFIKQLSLLCFSLSTGSQSHKEFSTKWTLSAVLHALLCHKYNFCRDKSFVATNTCLSRENTSFVATKVCLSRQNFCRDKHILSQQKTCFCCCDKHKKHATKIILVAAPANDTLQHGGLPASFWSTL